MTTVDAILFAKRVRDLGKLPENAPPCLDAILALLQAIDNASELKDRLVLDCRANKAEVDALREQSKIDSLIVGKLQAQLLTATEDTALINRWEKGEWLIGMIADGRWQAAGQQPGTIGKGFVGKSVRDVLRQIRDLT